MTAPMSSASVIETSFGLSVWNRYLPTDLTSGGYGHCIGRAILFFPVSGSTLPSGTNHMATWRPPSAGPASGGVQRGCTVVAGPTFVAARAIDEEQSSLPAPFGYATAAVDCKWPWRRPTAHVT